jgi:hypothetical protein
MHGSFNGIEEVVGSIPSGSTKSFNNLSSYSGEIYTRFRSKIATSSPPRSKKQTFKARYSKGSISAMSFAPGELGQRGAGSAAVRTKRRSE